ncbi:MAG: hypothetical protein V3U80_09030 [Flavobacteriaceae bacterium]
MFFLNENENPFKTNERKYPIDFATAFLNNYDVNIKIPSGYKVEKLPESVEINTENGIGNFSYKSSLKEDIINFKINFKVNVAIVPSIHYKELKDFYTAQLLKLNEKIILIKK